MVQTIFQNFAENFSNISFKYIDKKNKSSKNAPMPYLNLLPDIFKYLKVLPKDEECVEIVDIVINKEKPEGLKSKCTPSDQ